MHQHEGTGSVAASSNDDGPKRPKRSKGTSRRRGPAASGQRRTARDTATEASSSTDEPAAEAGEAAEAGAPEADEPAPDTPHAGESGAGRGASAPDAGPASDAGDDGAETGDEDIRLGSWAGISSYADVEGFMAEELRAERFHHRLRERARRSQPAAGSPRPRPTVEREPFEWRDLVRNVHEARTAVVLGIGALMLVVGLVAIGLGISARGAANDYRTQAEQRIDILTSELDAARDDLARARETAGAVAPAIELSHFTVVAADAGSPSPVSRIGLWETAGLGSDTLPSPTLRTAIDTWGAPDALRTSGDDRSTCRAAWETAGVEVTFTRTGTSTTGEPNPAACEVPDLVTPATVRLTGPAWRTGDGLVVGDGVDGIEEAYPDAERSGDRFLLVSRYSLAESRDLPVLVAATEDDTVSALVVNFPG